MSINAVRKNKILVKISQSTVLKHGLLKRADAYKRSVPKSPVPGHIYLWEEKATLPFMSVMSGSVSSLSCSLTAITAAETGKEVEDG